MIPQYNKKIQLTKWNDIVDLCGNDKVSKSMDFWWMLHGFLNHVTDSRR